MDPAWIDATSGAPGYSGQELRLTTIAPFVAGAGASLGVRSGVRSSGSGTDLLVAAQSTPNMTVKVNPGVIIAQGATSATQGAYSWALDAVKNVTIAAAHATLSRTDLIAVRIRDANVDTSGARDGDVVAITGTSGGGVPSLPTDATYVEIARITVAAAVTTITSGAIVDKRPFTAALGGVIPCTSTTRPTGVPAGQQIYETDSNFRLVWNGAKYLRSADELLVITAQGWTSTTTYTLVSAGNTTPAGGVQFPVEANSRYSWELDLAVQSSASVGLSVQMLYPAGATADLGWLGIGVVGGLAFGWTQGYVSATQIGVFGGTTVSTLTRLRGQVITAGTSGTVQFGFTQGTSDTATAFILPGSALRHRQIA